MNPFCANALPQPVRTTGTQLRIGQAYWPHAKNTQLEASEACKLSIAQLKQYICKNLLDAIIHFITSKHQAL